MLAVRSLVSQPLAGQEQGGRASEVKKAIRKLSQQVDTFGEARGRTERIKV